jgi:enterochelin esterase-like enzyme
MADPLKPAQVRIHYPRANAQGIALRGDGKSDQLSWDKSRPARQDGDTWTVEVPPSAFGGASTLEVKAMLRAGQGEHWSKGANYAIRAGAVTDIYPRFGRERGQVKCLFPSLHSDILDNDRAVHVYVPASFEENPSAPYPLVLMHDGQNIFSDQRATYGRSWRAGPIMDALIDQGKIPEAILVAVDFVDRFYEYTPSHDPSFPERTGGGRRYVEFLVKELLPKLRQTLGARLKDGPDAMVMIGSSLGALISLLAAELYPDVFRRVAAMSPATDFNNCEVIGRMKELGSALSGPSKLYVDCGGAGKYEDGVTDTRRLAVVLNSIGYKEDDNFKYLERPGDDHNEEAWERRLPHALQFLLDGIAD